MLLFVACLVAIVTRRIGLPYAIGLVVAGIRLSLAGYQCRIALKPELIFTFLLPPLIFAAAPAELPEHDALIGVAFAGVAFSIFVQGLTVPRLLNPAVFAKN